MDKESCVIEGKNRSLYLGPLHRWCKKHLFSIFYQLQFGTLTVNTSGKRYEFGCQEGRCDLSASVTVHDPRFYSALLFKGSLGAAESYMKGHWSAKDLTTLVRLFVINTDLLNRRMDAGWTAVTAPLLQLFHMLRKNTRRGSKKNIIAHYDLSNDFFKLFLDRTMGYSCGIFVSSGSSLHEAQVTKFERICNKLELTAKMHVIEIGGGWGGFALHAARHYGCRVTTTTLSNNQYRYMQSLVAESGLADRITVLQQDYREITGTFDRLVSIEMIEAVGHQFLETFVECCCKLLKADGRMALQAITIPDSEFSRHKHSVDFIKRHIFPGSCIPSVAAIIQGIAQKTDLRLIHFEDLTPHYATTLRCWRERFLSKLERVTSMGFSDEFIRMWEFYLASCEGSFQERYNNNAQMIFARPHCRHNPILPPLN